MRSNKDTADYRCPNAKRQTAKRPKKELARTDGERLEPGGSVVKDCGKFRCVAFLAVASAIFYGGCYGQMTAL